MGVYIGGLLAICALSGIAYLVWRMAKDKVAFHEHVDRASKAHLAALAETEKRMGQVLAEIAQNTNAIGEIQTQVEACEAGIAQTHGVLAAIMLRDLSGESDLEKVIGEGAVKKYISCQSRQRILLVTDEATGSETRYAYSEDGKVESQTRIHNRLRFVVSYSPSGVPLEGLVYGDDEKRVQKFVYDEYGQVKERVTL